MKSAAAIVLGLAATACSHDFDSTVSSEEQQSIDNAQQTLGFYIPENQDWVMTSAVTANLPIDGYNGLTYKVKVYSNNPVQDNIGYVITQKEVLGGQNFISDFSIPAYMTSIVIGIEDEFGETIYKKANVENGQITRFVTDETRTRSMESPACPDITQPYDETWVATYNQTAKEPTSENVADNYDNSYYTEGTPATEGTPDTYPTNWWDHNAINSVRSDENDPGYIWLKNNVGWDRVGGNNFTDEEWANLIAKAKADGFLKFFYVQKGTDGTPATEGYWTYDETFVRNFKITGTYDGAISVVATEGLTDGVANGNERTVVVTGTWNITEDQRVGSKGKIIIANGGTVNVASGKTLNMVNEARLVVLPGGKLTGDGKVEVNNGNAAGEENYNGGTIDVAVFNNNFGKFYNYGKFLVTEYQGGAKESNFYNHSLVSIKHTGLGSETPNARIFNACQWYCEGDMRCRNYEGVNGSAFIVGGQLMVSGSEDGTTTPSYFGLAAGALVKVGSLYNNGTSWTGPTSGYAALEIDNQIDFLNWQQDAPATGGYFQNNIYVKASNWSNIPGGNGFQSGETATADYKFWNIVANCCGNGGVKKVNAGNNVLIDASSNFELGKTGCTPGFKGDTEKIKEENNYYTFAFEDNRVRCDFDLNDVVLQVKVNESDNTKFDVKLVAAGCEYDNYVYLGTTRIEWEKGAEVHAALGVDPGVMVNTKRNTTSATPVTVTISNQDYTLDNAPFRIMPCKTGSGSDAAENQLEKNNNGFIDLSDMNSDRGKAPIGLRFPIKWRWPNERVIVTDAYEYFNQWAGNPDIVTRATQADWYKYIKDESKVANAQQ